MIHHMAAAANYSDYMRKRQPNQTRNTSTPVIVSSVHAC